MSDTSSKDFVEFIKPFLAEKKTELTDVGAHKGYFSKEFLEGGVNVVKASLFEPNKDSFLELKKQKDLKKINDISYNNVAVGASESTVLMKKADTMTKVVDSENIKGMGDQYFNVNCVALDSFFQKCSSKNNNLQLLKVDVEGFEMDVLNGAKKLFASSYFDIIYIEAGLNPNNSQQTYYRNIEDFMHVYSYKLCRIFEQKHEWVDDSPFLRRMNMVFLSEKFAESHPYKKTKNKYDLSLEKGDAKNLEKVDFAAKKDSLLSSQKKEVALDLSLTFKKLESFHWLVNALNIRGRLPYLEKREMSPEVLLSIHEYIRANRPYLVVVLGGEAVSIVVADALKQNGIGRAIVFDHSKNYGRNTKKSIESEFLDAWCESRVSPLKDWGDKHLALHSVDNSSQKSKIIKWYNPDDFDGLQNINFLVVDGPHSSLCAYARYPAMSVLFEKLAPDAEIWLDDVDKHDEKEIYEEWSKEYSHDFSYAENESGVAKFRVKKS